MEGLIADVGLRPARVGGLDQMQLLDGVLRLWFALAIGQKMGRHLAFKLLMPSNAPTLISVGRRGCCG